jgi:hypothetical protein
LFIEEKVHPKVLIDDLLRRSSKAGEQSADDQVSPLRRRNVQPGNRGEDTCAGAR